MDNKSNHHVYRIWSRCSVITSFLEQPEPRSRVNRAVPPFLGPYVVGPRAAGCVALPGGTPIPAIVITKASLSCSLAGPSTEPLEKPVPTAGFRLFLRNMLDLAHLGSAVCVVFHLAVLEEKRDSAFCPD